MLTFEFTVSEADRVNREVPMRLYVYDGRVTLTMEEADELWDAVQGHEEAFDAVSQAWYRFNGGGELDGEPTECWSCGRLTTQFQCDSCANQDAYEWGERDSWLA